MPGGPSNRGGGGGGFRRGGGAGAFGRGGGGGGFGQGGGGLGIFSHATGNNPNPDSKVYEVEDAIQRAGSGLAPVNQMPRRPAYGTQGNSVKLWANYFRITSKNDSPLFRYKVEILQDSSTEEKPVGRRLKRIIDLLLEDHFSHVRADIATDYKSTLIARVELPISGQGYDVHYRHETEDPPTHHITTYRLKVTQDGTVSIPQLINHLTSTNVTTMHSSKDEAISALNIVLGHYPKSAPGIFSVGANKHYRLDDAYAQKVDLEAGLQVVRGYFLSVRAASARLLLNVQVKHATCYKSDKLEATMDAFLKESPGDWKGLEKFLTKVRVRVTHIKKQNRLNQDIVRMKTIFSLAKPGDGKGQENPPIVLKFAAGPKDVFFFVGSKEGGQKEKPGRAEGQKKGKSGPPELKPGYISVFEFFQRTHNIITTRPNLPVVNVGNDQYPSYLPAQVCSIPPGQPSASQPTPAQQARIIKFAVRLPVENAKSIVEGGPEILGIGVPNSTLSRFGLSITPNLLAVPGRELMGPTVKYQRDASAITRFGSWNMRQIKFFRPAYLPMWTCLKIEVAGRLMPWQTNHDAFEQHLFEFEKKMEEVGICVGSYREGLTIIVSADRITRNRVIDDAIRKFASANPHPDVLLVILPSADIGIYNRVKFACDVRGGLRNVCVVAGKFAKPQNHQYFANVALKFNLKLGGCNQVLDGAKLGVIAEGKTMVVGLDVTHPSPGSSTAAPSVAAIVASVDKSLAQWPADLRVQTARQEMIDGLVGMVQSRLQLWAKHNGKAYPENIIVYRDGVSEGQYVTVLDQELPLIRRACSEMYSPSDTSKGFPRISIIVVGKRHHTRFYPTSAADADRSSNTKNGTIVDRGVTEARNWDFFLQAHTAIQGTARPAHYYVVLDEIFRRRQESIKKHPKSAAEALEELTHNMCYLFGRATKAVSICPPAYYADLVCERARCYLSRVFDEASSSNDADSVISGTGNDHEAYASEVRVHERVKDSMFYV